ncbi:MAG: adenosine deaminase, partial [Gemmatimonadaceae bacterium]
MNLLRHPGRLATLRWIAALALVIGSCRPIPPVAPAPLVPPTIDAEAATAAYMDSIRANPNALLLFLREMPKGGDLHNHLVGSVYAESFIKWAGEDGLCLVRPSLALKAPPCSARRNEIKASVIAADASLTGAVVDAWSIRNWNAARISGHDQFFATFEKFGAAAGGRTGDMLAEVTARAADQNISYMELMHSPDNGAVIGLAMPLRFEIDLGRMRERIMARGL